jgi:hypothetical protein
MRRSVANICRLFSGQPIQLTGCLAIAAVMALSMAANVWFAQTLAVGPLEKGLYMAASIAIDLLKGLLPLTVAALWVGGQRPLAMVAGVLAGLRHLVGGCGAGFCRPDAGRDCVRAHERAGGTGGLADAGDPGGDATEPSRAGAPQSCHRGRSRRARRPDPHLDAH